MSKTMSVKEVIDILEKCKVYDDKYVDYKVDALCYAIKILKAFDEAERMLPEKKKLPYDIKSLKNNNELSIQSLTNMSKVMLNAYVSCCVDMNNRTIDEVTPIFAKLISENKELKEKLEYLHSKFGMPLDDAMKFNGDNI